MSRLFNYSAHPRIEERAKIGPTTVEKAVARAGKGEGAVTKFNNKIGLLITNRVGTMWCAYLFAVIALISLPAAIASGSALVMVAWVAQTFLQLVLLPVIMVGQNIQSAAADTRSLATYEDAGAILDETRQLQEHLQAQDVVIENLLAEVIELKRLNTPPA